MVNLIYEGFGRWRRVVSVEQYERLLQAHKALQELLAVWENELNEAREIIETLGDKDFFDTLAQAVISQLRRERDAARQVIAQSKVLLADVQADGDYWRVAAEEKGKYIKGLRARLLAQDATIAKWEKITSTSTCCAYCGAAYPEGTPRFGGDALTEHIKVCPKHPMRQAEERVRELEAVVRARDFELEVKLADVQTDADYWRVQCMEVAEEKDKHIEALEQRVKEEKAWAQYREDMYVAVRKQLRRAGVIKPHEEITVEDAVERLLRQVPARTFDV